MRLRQIITTEEADATSTTAGDIASVTYPLFVAGRTRRARRRNARRAVGQAADSAPSYIGKGVYENQDLNEFAPGGAGIPPKGPKTPGKDPWGGDDGPGDDPYSRPEPEYYKRSIDFFGQFEADHFDREDFDKKTGVFKGYWENNDGSFVQIAYFKFDDPQQAAREFDDSPGMGWYYEPVEESVAEAHTLNSDNVIYRLDREDPMNASEVLVLGGAGRYSMAGLRDKARREARALAADLEGNHGGAFRGAAHNIKQLTNTLNTIVAAYNELKRIRSRGGRGSRGITDEDANFIRECLAIAEQWTQRYIAENGRNPGTPIPFPPGTTEIDVSDTTDWYRLGLEISDLDDAEPEEFNQGPPHTVVTFANDEMEQPYLKQFKRLGFKVKDIDQPDVRKFSKQEKKS